MSDDVPTKRGPGYPTKYRPEFAKQAEKLCDLGATDADLAEFFGVCLKTIRNWMVQHPKFAEAVSVYKEGYDRRVARSLAQRAIGYDYDAVKIFAPSRGKDENGNEIVGEPIVVPYREHVPPDVGAAIKWLTVRRADLWPDAKKIELSGPDGGPIETAQQHVDLSSLSDEEIEILRQAAVIAEKARTPR